MESAGRQLELRSKKYGQTCFNDERMEISIYIAKGMQHVSNVFNL